ncbi:hypothetical protein DFJ43DRAFT_1101842 [Lentinula guzmanii]|uniref:Transcription initiation factor TFIID subunit 8 n=1 Tax=Lentinula guzmanii TaxID=2804957 RepID=A0AA38MW45_9AGAR|nr:hypothetical protein DFJ43DRAFT_1101842 [Lentinula guzmanii]
MSTPIPQISSTTSIPNYYPQAHYTAPAASPAMTSPAITSPAMTSTTHYTPLTTTTQYLAHYSGNASTPNPISNPYGSYSNTTAYSFPTTYTASYGLGATGLPVVPGTANLGGIITSSSTGVTGTHKTPSGTLRPSSPVSPSVTGREASQAIQRLAASELRNAGFSGAKPEALYVLEQEVVGFVQSLYTLAHQYSNLANRSGPIATDLLLATEELDREWAYEVGPETLAKWLRKRERRKAAKDTKGKGKNTTTEGENQKSYLSAPSLIPYPTRSPTPELLSSDDDMDVEDNVGGSAALIAASATVQSQQVSQIPPTAHPTHLSLAPPSLTLNPNGGGGMPPGTSMKLRSIPASTLRNLPGDLPGLPPKHTYLQTPITTRRTTSQPHPTSTSSSSTSSSDPTKPKSQNQLQMEKKLHTAALVQESLKNLLLATEYTEDPEIDSGGVSGATTARENAELLGHIVNWESTVGGGRKRWRV